MLDPGPAYASCALRRFTSPPLPRFVPPPYVFISSCPCLVPLRSVNAVGARPGRDAGTTLVLRAGEAEPAAAPDVGGAAAEAGSSVSGVERNGTRESKGRKTGESPCMVARTCT